ncbi:enoyl-CoA hydratase/isomerase family protein [Arthrobacter sp. I2-34]|uniref:3-hydroxyisobutyryl-CoA hydrolase n=1 Tax=Arthrobacter hankyongi TaxID=2904801 RepID=A0ABS9L449_9MICC|nr:enoyl-CoA hydratase/isomerase family protein [Arthrobacter hankyongi]MCG2621262.1 enoyl-CoA hydratase/isomerase family protein [Arthrobacter hankyongi]
MDSETILRREGRLGHIILNRPQAMNALTHRMVAEITAALEAWREDDGVAAVLLTGAGERGLCAGGDIVAIYRDALQGGKATAAFWADEYRLNARIARYPKPYVAVMDGVVLGGGVGVSAHAGIRVVTERSKIGMPETGIGFVPDVGGTWLLSHAPGELGTHVALTAGSIGGSDAIALGLADHFISSSDLPVLAQALAHGDAVETVQSLSSNYFPPSGLAAERSWINECYAFDTVEQILGALQASPVPAAHEAAAAILAKSPMALKVALASLRRARDLASLEEALDQEFRVSLRFLAGSEFTEGIRAQVIDKDRNPRWAPPLLHEVTADDVEEYFADLGPRELGLAAQLHARS